jgi:hypothetical protein
MLGLAKYVISIHDGLTIPIQSTGPDSGPIQEHHIQLQFYPCITKTRNRETPTFARIANHVST